jgi:hypothetical protein
MDNTEGQSARNYQSSTQVKQNMYSSANGRVYLELCASGK